MVHPVRFERMAFRVGESYRKSAQKPLFIRVFNVSRETLHTVLHTVNLPYLSVFQAVQYFPLYAPRLHGHKLAESFFHLHGLTTA